MIRSMMGTMTMMAALRRRAALCLAMVLVGLCTISAQAQISLDSNGLRAADDTRAVKTTTTTSSTTMAAAADDVSMKAADLTAAIDAPDTGEATAETKAAEPLTTTQKYDVEPEIFKPADLAWTMVGAILVMFMQAGFALLEGGLARSKNAVNVLMKNYTDMVFGSIVFWALGFGLMFGHSWNGFIGTSFFIPEYTSGDNLAFMIFQMMFAATAATIVSGACAERTKYSAYLINAILITGFTYSIFGHWAWGGLFRGSEMGTGWLANMGFLDYAGSTVVHSMGGWSALAAIIVVGPRLGRFSSTGEARSIPGHNLMMVALGGFILWFGWFGFNAGSSNTATPIIGKIMMNTHLAGCAGCVGSMLYLRLQGKRVLLTGSINGGLGGLVAITAGCAYVQPIAALIIGFIAGLVVTFAGDFITWLKLDDVVGAVAVHGFGGAWGTLATGMFHEDGWFDMHRMFVQLVGVLTAFVWGFGCTFIFYWLTKMAIGVRVSTMHEMRGLDYTEHDEVGYPEFDPTLLHAENQKES